MEPESFPHVDRRNVNKFRNVIGNFYRKIDEILGRIISVIDDKINLIIVSDHGLDET